MDLPLYSHAIDISGVSTLAKSVNSHIKFVYDDDGYRLIDVIDLHTNVGVGREYKLMHGVPIDAQPDMVRCRCGRIVPTHRRT